MSRRESRNSSGGRQTSALEEFENCRPKRDNDGRFSMLIPSLTSQEEVSTRQQAHCKVSCHLRVICGGPWTNLYFYNLSSSRRLNSSLNVRIDELLAQITALNIDNLRLRASEMSLARKLENEQDRTRRLYRETESAVRRRPLRLMPASVTL
jgi:hypothetical protein